MSHKIKKRNDVNLIKEPGNKTITYPVLCFKYLTKNKKYNIKYFKKVREKQKAYGALFHLISRIQSNTWVDLLSKNKKIGFETISCNELNLQPNQYNLTPDTKIYVLRFARGKYRLLGVKSSENKDVLHIIGFDFDHSAYNHGS